MTGTAHVGSRPRVASPSGNGMVESFIGPAIASSLGCNQALRLRADFLITAEAELQPASFDLRMSERLILGIRTVSRTIRSDRFKGGAWREDRVEPFPRAELTSCSQNGCD